MRRIEVMVTDTHRLVQSVADAYWQAKDTQRGKREREYVTVNGVDVVVVSDVAGRAGGDLRLCCVAADYSMRSE